MTHPHVIILRNLHANYIHLPMLLKYLAANDIPTVVVLHDFWFFTGHCCHYTEDGCYKWQTECDHCPILYKYNKSLFFDRSKTIFNDKKYLFGKIRRLGVIGVSDWTINEAKRSFFKDAKVIRRIYNWIDLEVFKPQETHGLREKLGISEEQFVVLGVAQGWSEQKGLHIFLEIAIHHPKIKVLLVGALDDSLVLPKNLISVGTVGDVHQLATYYSLADVFLNPSIQETFGKVSAEALACGTPVIANDATANPEIVGDCGVVIDNNNLQEIFSAINQIKQKGKKAYSIKCLEHVRNLFCRNMNIEKYIEVVKEL